MKRAVPLRSVAYLLVHRDDHIKQGEAECVAQSKEQRVEASVATSQVTVVSEQRVYAETRSMTRRRCKTQKGKRAAAPREGSLHRAYVCALRRLAAARRHLRPNREGVAAKTQPASRLAVLIN